MPVVTSVKHPAEIRIWSTFSCCAMFQLHMMSRKTTIRDEYYRNNSLANIWLKAFNRTAQEGSVSNRVHGCLIQAKLSSCGAARQLKVPRRMRSDAERTSYPSGLTRQDLKMLPTYLVPSECLWTIVKQEENERTLATRTAQL